MPQMSKIELHAAIRRDHRGGMKIREIERKYNVSWRAVRKAVDSVWPEPRKHLPPRPTALDPYKPLVDEMLRTDLDAPRRQRHTITRIFHHPVEEHAADLSYQMVRRYVSDRKPQILIESGKAPAEAFVPQTHQPGMEAEVDFGDVTPTWTAHRPAGSLNPPPAKRPLRCLMPAASAPRAPSRAGSLSTTRSRPAPARPGRRPGLCRVPPAAPA